MGLLRSGQGGVPRPATSILRRAWRAALALLLVLTVSAGSGVAQPLPPTGGGESGGPYRLGTGDVLRLDVTGRTDISGSYTIAEDGTVTIPVVGTVRVQGRTVAEVRSDLARRISLFDRSNPQVTLSIGEFKSRKVFVLGAVLLPGIYAFAEMPTVWDAIAEAGGPLDDANLTAVEFIPGDTSGGRKTTILDIATAIRESRTESLPRLRPGDTVRVPRGVTSSSVLLIGAIGRPGPLPFDQAPDLVTAVMRGGGPTPDAKTSEVQVIRQTGSRTLRMRVNMDDYLKKANLAGNPKLEAGDTVYLPRADSRRGFMTYVGVVATFVGLISSIVVLAR